jgi:hypothetical protein
MSNEVRKILGCIEDLQAAVEELRKAIDRMDPSPWLKFRKKPVVVMARRVVELEQVMTLEGPLLAEPGDWMIRGIEGELYPCKDSVFRKTYEEME